MTDTPVSAVPVAVSQETVETFFGLSPRQYLDLIRRGAFPAVTEGHRRIALVEDVRRYLMERLAARPASPAVEPSAVDKALAAGGLRRTG